MICCFIRNSKIGISKYMEKQPDFFLGVSRIASEKDAEILTVPQHEV